MNFLIVLIISLSVFQTSPSIDEVRKKFPDISSEEQADDFIIQLNADDSVEAKGYIAAMNFMKSRFVKNPFTKFKYFKIGKKELDEVILNNPKNVEMRYIRYLMQKQIPEFLGYHENISEDFNVIADLIESSTLNEVMKRKILKNMLLVSNLTIEEKNILTKIETSL
ncbi:hypothetical protein ACFQ5N_11355 [Lutibacter holmesii]|uniref:Uncharacterized protein n=1 Tax=Lutibacter holmesii TaxID=1137985 RepID=A0ABW3WRM0_9FLAO